MGHGYEIEIECDGATATHGFRSEIADFGQVDSHRADFSRLDELIMEGCKAYAGTLIDYDSFGSDSRYLDEIDARIATFRILGLEAQGKKQRYLADTLYPQDGGGWTDNVTAIDDDEARFQARWVCAVNVLAGRGVHDLTLKAMEKEGFAGEIEEIAVNYVLLEPVKTEEALACLSQLVVKPTWQALQDARDLLAKATQTFPDPRGDTEPETETPTTVERTFAMIKSGAVARGSVKDILKTILGSGFEIVRLRRQRLSRRKAEEFYAEHAGRTYFAGLIESVTSGDVVLLELEKADAVVAWRKLLGATDPTQAQPGTIRHAFGGTAMPDNAAHGADSPIAALQETLFMFGSLP